MDFTVQHHDSFTTIKVVAPKLTSLNAVQLRKLLKEMQKENVKNINLHIGNVSFIDSSGLSAILIARKICKDSNGSFVLSGLHPNIIKLLRVSQLDTIIDTLPTMEEAEDYIKMEELTRQISGL